MRGGGGGGAIRNVDARARARACCRRRAVVAVARARLEANPRRASRQTRCWAGRRALRRVRRRGGARTPRVVSNQRCHGAPPPPVVMMRHAACARRLHSPRTITMERALLSGERSSAASQLLAGSRACVAGAARRRGRDGSNLHGLRRRSLCRSIQYLEGLCKLPEA